MPPRPMTAEPRESQDAPVSPERLKGVRMFLVIGSGCEGAETAPVEPCKAAGTVICQLTSRSLDAAATLTRSSVERHRTFF